MSILVYALIRQPDKRLFSAGDFVNQCLERLTIARVKKILITLKMISNMINQQALDIIH